MNRWQAGMKWDAAMSQAEIDSRSNKPWSVRTKAKLAMLGLLIPPMFAATIFIGIASVIIYFVYPFVAANFYVIVAFIVAGIAIGAIVSGTKYWLNADLDLVEEE